MRITPNYSYYLNMKFEDAEDKYGIYNCIMISVFFSTKYHTVCSEHLFIPKELWILADLNEVSKLRNFLEMRVEKQVKKGKYFNLRWGKAKEINKVPF